MEWDAYGLVRVIARDPAKQSITLPLLRPIKANESRWWTTAAVPGFSATAHLAAATAATAAAATAATAAAAGDSGGSRLRERRRSVTREARESREAVAQTLKLQLVKAESGLTPWDRLACAEVLPNMIYDIRIAPGAAAKDEVPHE